MPNKIKCYRTPDGLKLAFDTAGGQYVTDTTKSEADVLAATIGASPTWIVQAGTGPTLWIARTSKRKAAKSGQQ